jgi:hypothetical protein
VAERQDSDREVLTSLPRSRPVRRSAKRGDRPDRENGATAHPRRAAAKPRGAKATTGGGAKATSGHAAKATAGGAKPASARAAKPKPKPKAARKTAERARVAPQRKVPPAGYAAPTSRPRDPASSGAADLISTTIQAAGELAQIGMTVGRQTLQSMIDRLPKP